MKPNLVFLGHFWVAKFKTILVILYDNQANKSSWNQNLNYFLLSTLPSSSFSLFVLLLTLMITAFLKTLFFILMAKTQIMKEKKKTIRSLLRICILLLMIKYIQMKIEIWLQLKLYFKPTYKIKYFDSIVDGVLRHKLIENY